MYFPKQQKWINPEPLNPNPLNPYKAFNTLYIIQLQQKNETLVPFCWLFVVTPIDPKPTLSGSRRR